MRVLLFFVLLLSFFNIRAQPAKAAPDTFPQVHFMRVYSNLYKITTAKKTIEWKRSETFAAIAELARRFRRDEKVFPLIAQSVNLTLLQIDSLIGLMDTSLRRSPYRGQAVLTRNKLAVTETGKRFPSLTLKDTSGKLFVLDSLRGKIVLVDVWSSWCHPCRAQIPDLRRLYKKYHDDNFEIIGVSLDEKKADWLTAIEKDKQSWPHFSELTSWRNNKFATRFFINAIPSNFLIDKDGIILGQDLTPGEVGALLAAELKKED